MPQRRRTPSATLALAPRRDLVLSKLLLLLLLGLAMIVPAALGAGEKRSDPRFSLHQVSKACGKKWLKRAKRLTARQWEWMLQTSHALYDVKVGGRTVITLEVLSTPSFRDCAVETQWAKKETTARLIRHRPDGTTGVRMVHFASDDALFNQAPRVLPGAGKVLLKGVTAGGAVSNRWVEFEPVPAAAPLPPRPVARVAQVGAAQ